MSDRQIKIICFFLYKIWVQVKHPYAEGNFIQMYSQAEKYADKGASE